MANRARQFVLYGSIFLMSLLTILAVLGAFAGAARAKLFFNSPQMAAFWCALLIVLLAGFIFFPALRRRKMLLLIHAGLILILAGGMYGSQAAHDYMNKKKSSPQLTRGTIALEQGQATAFAAMENGQLFELPFSVRLKNASVDFYDHSQMVRDYFSEVQILVRDQVVKEGIIEVNKPLYYKGYHLYQSTFGYAGTVPVSGLLIVSARGTHLVFAGYFLTAAGMLGLCWRVLASRKSSVEAAA